MLRTAHSQNKFTLFCVPKFKKTTLPLQITATIPIVVGMTGVTLFWLCIVAFGGNVNGMHLHLMPAQKYFH